MIRLDLIKLSDYDSKKLFGGIGGVRPLDPPPGENPDDPDGKCGSRMAP